MGWGVLRHQRACIFPNRQLLHPYDPSAEQPEQPEHLWCLAGGLPAYRHLHAAFLAPFCYAYVVFLRGAGAFDATIVITRADVYAWSGSYTLGGRKNRRDSALLFSGISLRMDTFAVVSVLEAVYIIYMFHFFRTRYSVHHPLEAVLTQNADVLRHPIATGLYESKICPLGSIVGIFVAIFILLRLRFRARCPRAFSIATKVIFSALALGALLSNMNAFIYIIPLLLVEYGYSGRISDK